MVVEGLKIKNFMGFRHFDLELESLSVLVGPNNGGKTSILRAVAFCIDAYRNFLNAGNVDRGPVFARVGAETPEVPIGIISQRMSILNSSNLFHNHFLGEIANLELRFGAEARSFVLEVDLLPNNENLRLRLFEITGEGKVNVNTDRDKYQSIANDLYNYTCEFVPPLGTLSAVETELSFPALQSELAQGRFSETWRNRLHWLVEGAPPERFQRVVETVSHYFPGVRFGLPQRTRTEQPPRVSVAYEESDSHFDISLSGGGLKTLVSLAASIELSRASLILFDEPDAHLHSSISREIARLLSDVASDGRQILVTTHSPDMIEVFPLDSLRWIDRAADKGRSCDVLDRVLVDLGAMTHTAAIASESAESVLFFEDKDDVRLLRGIFDACGKGPLLNRFKASKLGGGGDTAHLTGAFRVASALSPSVKRIAAIRDADYSSFNTVSNIYRAENVLLCYLPCKELENLFVLQAACIGEAIKEAAVRRSSRLGLEPQFPSIEDVDAQIDQITQQHAFKDTLRSQYLFWRISGTKGGGDAGVIQDADRDFEKHWESADWRRRHCPGKQVLRGLNDWVSAEFKVSFKLAGAVRHFQPTSELTGMFEALEEFVADSPTP